MEKRAALPYEFLPLTTDANARLETLRAHLKRRLALVAPGAPQDNSTAVIPVLQRFIDNQALRLDPVNEWEAAGAMLGDVFARELGLEWWSLRDGWGETICLRHAETTLRMHPIDMLAKRAQKGEPIDVRHIFDNVSAWTREAIASGQY